TRAWKRRRARWRPTAPSRSPSIWTSCSRPSSASTSVHHPHEPAQQALAARVVRERQVAGDPPGHPAEQRLVLYDGLEPAELAQPFRPMAEAGPARLHAAQRRLDAHVVDQHVVDADAARLQTAGE